MKRLFSKGNTMIVLLMAMALIVSCSTVTDLIYGPDMTPEELRSAIYQDAFAIGAIAASGKDSDSVAHLIRDAETVRMPSPELAMQQAFLSELREGDTENAFLWFAARRVYGSLGARLIDDKLDASGLDLDLWGVFVDAYIQGAGSALAPG